MLTAKVICFFESAAGKISVGKLKLRVLLPDQKLDTIYAVGFLRFISPENMTKLKTNGVESRNLDVIFPKFKIKTDTGLLSVLKEMGISKVFINLSIN